MKAVVTLVFLCIFTLSAACAQKSHGKDSVDVIIRLRNRTKKPIKDSIVVIFDRYDRRAAGVIRQVFVPVNNRIVLLKVPAAKYYIEVSSFNPAAEKYRIVSYISKRRVNEFVYDVKLSDTFIPGLVIIPAETIDLNNLKILKSNLN